MASFEYVTADGRYDLGAIMREAWRGVRAWNAKAERKAPLASFLRHGWSRARIQRDLWLVEDAKNRLIGIERRRFELLWELTIAENASTYVGWRDQTAAVLKQIAELDTSRQAFAIAAE
ncbi:hypothetical protein CHELA1G11_12020 [Hyphomicrobiales bacterium]|nr:hypothetical protein CHELA1G11_12020 [Hyphomicrobiales bacterium]CAH1663850.1 hypothetical protein CHELA1G2_12292 [Hyphomicrobiales bacterium]